MGFGAIFFLALGLSMDAAAAAATRGASLARIDLRHALLVALFFGGFQALMPLAGWMIGSGLGPMVEAWDHWIAWLLLTALGGKLFWEARHAKLPDAAMPAAPDFRLRTLLVLAIATSIDAMAAGIPLPMMNAPLLLSVLTIGVTTAVLSVLGLYAGRRFGALLGGKLDIAGGLILIALGQKILLEHEFAGRLW